MIDYGDKYFKKKIIFRSKNPYSASWNIMIKPHPNYISTQWSQTMNLHAQSFCSIVKVCHQTLKIIGFFRELDKI